MLKCFRKNDSNFFKRRAFTLSELLIALGVIGVLTAVLMPIIFSLAPNQNVLMAKRAFYTIETIVSDMLNDPNCYPKINARVGFDDGLGYAKCDKYGGKDNPSKLGANNPSEKFITLFTDRLDLKKVETTEGDSDSTYITKDGMEWRFKNLNFQPAQADSYGIITVDVNSSKHSPNCGDSTGTGKCEKENAKSFDKFSVRVLARGKIQMLDCWAAKAVQTDKKLVGKDVILPADCKDTCDPEFLKTVCAKAVAENPPSGCANRYTGEINGCDCASVYSCVDDGQGDSDCGNGSTSHQGILNNDCPSFCQSIYSNSYADHGNIIGSYLNSLGNYQFVYNNKVYKWIGSSMNICSKSPKFGTCAYLGGNDYAFWITKSDILSCCCKAEYVQDY